MTFRANVALKALSPVQVWEEPPRIVNYLAEQAGFFHAILDV